jgi:hypothetical protein
MAWNLHRKAQLPAIHVLCEHFELLLSLHCVHERAFTRYKSARDGQRREGRRRPEMVLNRVLHLCLHCKPSLTKFAYIVRGLCLSVVPVPPEDHRPEPVDQRAPEGP